MNKEQLKEQLIEEVVENAKNDIIQGDYEALFELLTYCPVENLIGYLPDENTHKQYKSLIKKK